MNTQVACFGEVLWDLLPSGKVAGGAPMNVACQLNNLGRRVAMISRVGLDELGNELSHFLQHRGVEIATLQVDAQYPTGVVNVSLSASGQPSYEIVQPAAWDYITSDETVQQTVNTVDLLVFGSLVCRQDHSKATLLELLPQAKKAVFDVNLRSPYYSPELIDSLAIHADILKLNDDELKEMSTWYGFTGDDRSQMAQVLERFTLQGLVQTRGAHGAIFFDGTQYVEHPGFKVQVKDTVGSGDAFLAGFLHGLLAGESAEACLAWGCGMGALTATHQGGTPIITFETLQTFITA